MIISARFNGPAGSGNGGYSAGVFAGHHAGSIAPADPAGPAADGARCEVTLRIPPPLDTPLSMANGRVHAPDGTIVAEIAPAGAIDTVVPSVGPDAAVVAARGYAGLADHPFPTCYVCGPDHADGLRIFPGRMPDGTTAAPWTVPSDVSPATVWAALDCPGGWAIIAAGRPYVLGRIAVLLRRTPVPGERCVVRGALASAEGRKALVHTTLYGPDGEELARARATWIAVAG